MSRGQQCSDDWIKCPCLLVDDVRFNGSQEVPAFQFAKGEECVVRATNATNGVPMVAIKSVWKKENATQWIPWRYLELPRSSSVKYGNVSIAPGIPTSLNPNVTYDLGKGVFQETVRGIFTGINKNKGDNGSLKGLVGSWMASKLDTETKMLGTLGQIVHGVRQAGLLDVLNDPKLDVWKILEGRKDLTSKNNQPGIYVIIYWDFLSDEEPSYSSAAASSIEDMTNVFEQSTMLQQIRKKTVKLYVGKTSNFHARQDQHKKSAGSENAENKQHYRQVKGARKSRLVPICVADTTDGIRSVIEQVFLCLFNAYSVHVLHAKATIDDKDQVAKIGKWDDDIKAANALARISNDVSRQTGWNGYVTNEQFQVTHGLNWKSPLMDGEGSAGHKQGWIHTEADDRDYYRRMPTRVHGNIKNTLDVWSLFCTNKETKSKYTGKFVISRSAKDLEGHMADGDEVEIIMEIMKNGRSHPIPWARLPPIGPFKEPEWTGANSLGVRLEWCGQDKKWRQQYVQSAFVMDSETAYRDPAIPGSLNNIATAWGLIYYFQRIEFKQPLGATPTWYKNFGIARIKKAKYNHLQQDVTFHETISKTIKELKLTRHADDNFAQYKQIMGGTLGHRLTNIDGQWATYPPGQVKPAGKLRCDRCRVVFYTSGKPCIRDGDSNRCKACKAFGFPCSWTSNLSAGARNAFAKPDNLEKTPVFLADMEPNINFDEDKAFSGRKYSGE